MNVVSLLGSMVRISLPLLLAALGILIASKAGIVYLVMEGNMMIAAFFGVYGAYLSGSAWVGVLFAVVSGIIFAQLFGLLVINGRGDQIVCGTGLNFFIDGITSVMMSALFGTKNISPEVERIPSFQLGGLGRMSDLLIIGLALLVMSWIMLNRTTLGLRIRAVGENPGAADSLGVKVYRYQYIALIFVGLFAGLAGAELTLGQLGYFSRNITASRGYIAFAIVVLGAYNPFLILFASLFIGLIDAFQMRAQSLYNLPTQIFLLLPYLLTVVVLLFGKKVRGPAHEGSHYIRE